MSEADINRALSADEIHKLYNAEFFSPTVTFTDFAGNKSTILRADPPSFFDGVQTDVRGALIERAREKVAAAAAAAAAAAVPAAPVAPVAPAAPVAPVVPPVAPAPAPAPAPVVPPAVATPADIKALNDSIVALIKPVLSRKDSAIQGFLQAAVDTYKTVEDDLLKISVAVGTRQPLVKVEKYLLDSIDDQLIARSKVRNFLTGGDLAPSKAREAIARTTKRITDSLAKLGIA